MIFWKEWRETRFSFLTALLFVCGISFTVPAARDPEALFWLGVFLVFFSMGFTVVTASGAFGSEIGAGTLPFLLSKPAGKSRFLLAKLAVRGTETALVFIAPATIGLIKEDGFMVFMIRLLNIIDPSIVKHPLFAPHWNASVQWLWVPPYLLPQYTLVALLAILFQFSGSFFFSTLIPKRALPALGGIVFCAAFFSLRGMTILHSAWVSTQVKADILLLFLLTLGLLVLSIMVFMLKEF